MTISNEAVEAAARAIFDTRDDPYDTDEWDEIDSTEREPYTCHARAALEAAAPIIRAEALEAAGNAYLAENADVNQRTGTPVATQEQWRFYHWLSLRSVAERGRQ